MVESDSNLEQTPRTRRRFGLATIMVGGVTLLILLAVGSVLLITLTSATRNTFELLADQADNTLDILESRIDRQLGPVVDAAGEFARQFADGRLNLDASRTNTLPRVFRRVVLQLSNDSDPFHSSRREIDHRHAPGRISARSTAHPTDP